MSSIASRIRRNLDATGQTRQRRGQQKAAFGVNARPVRDFGLLGKMVESLKILVPRKTPRL